MSYRSMFVQVDMRFAGWVIRPMNVLMVLVMCVCAPAYPHTQNDGSISVARTMRPTHTKIERTKIE